MNDHVGSPSMPFATFSNMTAHSSCSTDLSYSGSQTLLDKNIDAEVKADYIGNLILRSSLNLPEAFYDKFKVGEEVRIVWQISPTTSHGTRTKQYQPISEGEEALNANEVTQATFPYRQGRLGKSILLFAFLSSWYTFAAENTLYSLISHLQNISSICTNLSLFTPCMQKKVLSHFDLLLTISFFIICTQVFPFPELCSPTHLPLR